MIARRLDDTSDATDLRLYGEQDLPWVRIIVDHVMTCAGQPWRVLRERLEHAPIRPPRVAAILAALRRVTGDRADRARIARKLRGLVLGPPALDDATRADRLAAAEHALGIDAAELESLLWIDLADERPVHLPDGRPDELRLIAYANVDRIQRALRRAQHVRIFAWGEATALVRATARRGLLARISRHEDTATRFDIVGPLVLFHATNVYGRALGALVPYLRDLDRFVLEIDADFGFGPALLRVTSPAILPPVPDERGTSLAARMAAALARHAPHARIEREPPPLVLHRDLLFPDLAVYLDAERWFVELVGFATADYLTAKLARYAAAGVQRVVLVVDDTRAPTLPGLERVVTYKSRTIARDLLAILEEAR